jgi:hypothetical protein
MVGSALGRDVIAQLLANHTVTVTIAVSMRTSDQHTRTSSLGDLTRCFSILVFLVDLGARIDKLGDDACVSLHCGNVDGLPAVPIPVNDA